MSFIHFHQPLTGFHFELRIDRLLGSLNYTVKYSNGNIPCLHQPPHNTRKEHEFDHHVIYRDKMGSIMPRYSNKDMIVSCKTTLKSMDAVKAEKIVLKKLISCYNLNVEKHNETANQDEQMEKISHGLIISGNKINLNDPDLGDGIFYWDLSRCFFYAWRAFYSKNLDASIIYGENKLDEKSSFIFGTAGDYSKDYNQGVCEIFYDSNQQLNQDKLTEYLTLILDFIKTSNDNPLIKKGTVYVTVHSLNNFPNQIVDRKDEIALNASDSNIYFDMGSYYNHSIAPWDPLTKSFSRFHSQL